MSRPKISDQLKSYESYINDIPLVINPCKQCEVYKKNKGYDMGHYDRKKDEYIEGVCKNCCWFYDSRFKIKADSGNNECCTCTHYSEMPNGKRCKKCDNGSKHQRG